MRAGIGLLAVLVAGCASEAPPPGSAPSSRWSWPEDPTLRCGHADPAVRECPYEWFAAPCAQLRIEASRRAEVHHVRAIAVNACGGTLWHQGLNMGDHERNGMRAMVIVNGTTYHLSEGAAWPSALVAPAIPPGQIVGPGSPVLAEWSWNGTLAGPGPRYEGAPAGEHTLYVELVRDPAANATGRIVVPG